MPGSVTNSHMKGQYSCKILFSCETNLTRTFLTFKHLFNSCKPVSRKRVGVHVYNNCLKTFCKRQRHLPFVKASHSCRPASLNIFPRSNCPPLSLVHRRLFLVFTNHYSFCPFLSRPFSPFPCVYVIHTRAREWNKFVFFNKSRITHVSFSQIIIE